MLLLVLMSNFNGIIMPSKAITSEMYYHYSYYTSNEHLVSKVDIVKNNTSIAIGIY
jgi:hypothetical protein